MMSKLKSWLSAPLAGKFLKPSNPKRKPPSDLSLEFRQRVFYIIFSNADSHLWTPFLRKGFRHCYVIERLEFIWMMFDPTRVGLNVVLPNCDVDHPLIENMLQLEPSLKILKVLTNGDGKSLVLKPKLLSCVSTVEYISGVGFNFCITPYSLYKKLKRCKHNNLISVREILLCPAVKKKQREQKKERWCPQLSIEQKEAERKNGYAEKEVVHNACLSAK